MKTKIKSVEVSKYNSNIVVIKFEDGRTVEVLFGPDNYNGNIISVQYHSHEWDWSKCEFVNFGYPSD